MHSDEITGMVLLLGIQAALLLIVSSSKAEVASPCFLLHVLFKITDEGFLVRTSRARDWWLCC